MLDGVGLWKSLNDFLSTALSHSLRFLEFGYATMPEALPSVSTNRVIAPSEYMLY